jgi:hypothetical protein
LRLSLQVVEPGKACRTRAIAILSVLIIDKGKANFGKLAEASIIARAKIVSEVFFFDGAFITGNPHDDQNPAA